MKQLYPFLAASSFIFISTTLFAATTERPWYLSVDGGVFQGMFDAQYTDQTDSLPQNYRQTVSQYGYIGGIAAGYSKVVQNQYLLGGELSGSLATNNAYFSAGASSSAFADKLAIKGNIDLTFVPGILISESIAMYGKLGLSYASISADINSPTGYTPTYSQSNSTRTVIGGAFGLGIKKKISDHLAIFTEYNYHDYGTVNFPTFQNFTATYAHAAHVYSNSLVVGVSYLI